MKRQLTSYRSIFIAIFFSTALQVHGQAEQLLVQLAEGESITVLEEMGHRARLVSKHMNVYSMPIGTQRRAIVQQLEATPGVLVVQRIAN